MSNRYVISADFRKLSAPLLRQDSRSGRMYVTTNRQVVCIRPSSLGEIICVYGRQFDKHSFPFLQTFLLVMNTSYSIVIVLVVNHRLSHKH